MTIRYFFDIPVYRCSSEKYELEMEKEKQKLIDYCGPYPENFPETKQRIIDHFNEKDWEPWIYNQIIGWIRLFRLSNQLRCDYFRSDKKRYRRFMGHKRFLYNGSFLLTDVKFKQSSEEIYLEIERALKEFVKQKQFKNRYVDFELFKSIGQFVDWRSLFNN